MNDSENPSYSYTLDLYYGTIQINTMLSKHLCATILISMILFKIVNFQSRISYNVNAFIIEILLQVQIRRLLIIRAKNFL